MQKIVMAAASLVFLAAPAWASTPEAWRRAEAASRRACFAAAGLRAPAMQGAPVHFAQKTLVLVAGAAPQRHMRGRRLTMACLFDRGTNQAEVQEVVSRR